MTTKVHRTYGSSNRNKSNFTPSSPTSNLSSSPPPQETRKRSFEETFSRSNKPPFAKRPKLSSSKPNEAQKQKTFTQLHFCIDQTVIKTCSLCGLSYTKGAEDDVALHRAHCMKVQKGMEWSREEEKESIKAGSRRLSLMRS
ncbi:hypothetical protein D9758_001624 [Tetrapyrgos nigripes]|uniref:N-acetyltransferase ESCO zinc-finger domain-containing protein n=1 Tax=Tetrapyrgos nigripes TaxID=182062 RepID=A0A8H5LXB0_9AGAR|nr:hypothetical protein D9758_001624 [Tetrapyrgos nigripes]